MTTNTELLKIARKYLGYNGDIFRKFAGLGKGKPYCNAFVSYIAAKGKVEKLYFDGKKETYCPHSYEWCKKNLAQVPPYLAMPMDPIYFDWQPNGVPDHIGFVTSRRDTNSVNTLEGNTSKKNKEGKVVANHVVAEKVRAGKNVQAIFRPKFAPPKKLKKKKIDEDGDFSWFSIYNLQIALGLTPTGILDRATVMALQKKAGAEPDAWWGPDSSYLIQKMIGAKKDKKFGKKSVKALQKWINSKNYPAGKSKKTTTKKTTTTTKKTTTATTAKKTTAGKKGGADIPYSKIKAGDALICYDKNGKFHHIVLATGNGKYIDCTNTSKNHIAERNYSTITKKYCVTRAFRPTDPKKAEAAVAWAKSIAKNGGYTYKHWKNSDKKTKLCPICHKLTGKYKGWNCIGFVTAAYYHGAKMTNLTCSCSGLGTDGFFTKVTLASWKKRNGNDWTMITN